MKILYYHQHFSTPSGSTGTRSYEMARRLIQHGHSVTMVCGSYGMGKTGLSAPFVGGRRSGVIDEINVIELELPYANRDGFFRRSLTFMRFAFRSAVIALSSSYDVVFATSTPLTAAIPGITAKLFRRKPFIFEVRDLWPELPKAMGVITNPVVLMLLSWLEWMAYRSATSVIGLSPGIVDGIKKRAGAGKQVAMVPNGCDLDIFRGAAEVRDESAEAGPGESVCVFMGAHGLANGLDAVLDVAAELKKRDRTDIKLVLIGDGKCKPALQQRATAEKLDNIDFMDPVPKTELHTLLRDADVGLMILANVSAFYFGTSPNKFFDYIAVGMPVLNNYPGWLAEMITREEAGIAVPPEDRGAFADALVYLADHPVERRKMGLNARRLAETEFDRDKLAEAFVAEFEELET